MKQVFDVWKIKQFYDIHLNNLIFLNKLWITYMIFFLFTYLPPKVGYSCCILYKMTSLRYFNKIEFFFFFLFFLLSFQVFGYLFEIPYRILDIFYIFCYNVFYGQSCVLNVSRDIASYFVIKFPCIIISIRVANS